MDKQRKSLLLTQGFIALALLALMMAFDPAVLHGGASSGPHPRPSEGEAPAVLISAASCQRDNGNNVLFPSVPNRWVSSPISVNCAPTGSSVTGIDVAARIEHFCPEVIRIELRYGGITLVLWNKEGSCGDVTYFAPSAIGDSTFNGMPVNGTWELWALDEVGHGRQYYIDYWTIKFYYGSPAPTPTTTPLSFASLSGRVYEGTTGQEPPSSSPIQGAKVELYCSNQPYPNQGTLLATTFTNSDGWYGLGVTQRNCQYYHIIETNPPGYSSDGATTAPGGGAVKSEDWIQYTVPLFGQTWTGNKFWDRNPVTNTPTRTPMRPVTAAPTPTPGPSLTPTHGPSPTWTFTPEPGEGADLEITKKLLVPPTGPIEPGDNLQYSIRVWNHGPAGAVGVVVTDTLPTGLGFVSSWGPCAVVQPGPPHDIVRCDLGTISSSFPQGMIVSMWSSWTRGPAALCATSRRCTATHPTLIPATISPNWT